MAKDQTLIGLITDWTSRFEKAGFETAMLDARVLALSVCGLEREDLVANPDFLISPDQIQHISRLCERRLLHEPVAHILGVREFWSLEFAVSKDTLVPRPDSETLVRLVLSLIEDKGAKLNLLDLGTGSGCLLIALLTELPSALGTGVDRSQGAIEIARQNAQTHRVKDRSKIFVSDWGKGLIGPYDIVISNPPYIPDRDRSSLAKDVVGFEPAAALFGGADGLDPLRAFIGDVKRLLTPEGFYVMEYGAGQSDAVTTILQESGFEIIEIASDLAGIERSIAAKVAKM